MDEQPATALFEDGCAAAPKRKRKAETRARLPAGGNKKSKKNELRAKTPPPTKILVIDNGGDTVKYGWNDDAQPRSMPNLTARLHQQWAVLAGDQVHGSVQNPASLQHVTWSMERGMIVNFGNQVQVWKRILDVMNISIPLHTETSQAFGWATTKSRTPTAAVADENPRLGTATSARMCAIVLTVPPYCPRLILDQIMLTWLEDFGFGQIGLVCSPLVAAVANKYETACVVDLGWSATHIVCSFQNRAISVKRVPIGARHLINMWKYYASYRFYNLMDQHWLLDQVLRDSAYVSLAFENELKSARRYPLGKRPYDREFVLPDFVETFHGHMRMPPALLAGIDDESGDDDEDDESIDEASMLRQEEEEDETKSGDANEADGTTGSDDPVDNVEERRQQRQLDELQRAGPNHELEEQILMLSIERFSIPEALFRPADANLVAEWAALPEAIVQAIEASPSDLQPALFQSIQLVGGMSQMPNLRERLDRELRSLAPNAYDTVITTSSTPVDQAWYGSCVVSKQEYRTWSISSDEWRLSSKRGIWKKLLTEQRCLLV